MPDGTIIWLKIRRYVPCLPHSLGLESGDVMRPEDDAPMMTNPAELEEGWATDGEWDEIDDAECTVPPAPLAELPADFVIPLFNT